MSIPRHLISFNKTELCIICFAVDRKMSTFKFEQIRMLGLLLENPVFEIESLAVSNWAPRICYECRKRVDNMIEFKTAVSKKITLFRLYLCASDILELPKHEPTLTMEDTSNKNLEIVHQDWLRSVPEEKSPDPLNENEIYIKAEIDEVPIDIEIDLPNHEATLMTGDTDKNLEIVHKHWLNLVPQNRSTDTPDPPEVTEMDIKYEIDEVPIDIEETQLIPVDITSAVKVRSVQSLANQLQGQSNVTFELMQRPRNTVVQDGWSDIKNRYRTIWATNEDARKWYEMEKEKYRNNDNCLNKEDDKDLNDIKGDEDQKNFHNQNNDIDQNNDDELNDDDEKRDITLESESQKKKIQIKCKLCETGFDTVAEMYQHYKLHHIHYGCKICNYKSRSLEDIELHCTEYQHSEFDGFDNTKYIICKKCGMALIQASHALRHRTQCYGKSFPCELCEMVYASRSSLHSHMLLRHKPMETQTCDICNKKYKNAFSLRAHKRTHSSQSETINVYYCGKCDVHFKSKYSLKKHLSTNLKHCKKDEVHRMPCPQCPAKFLDMTSVNKHIAIVHLGVKFPRKKKVVKDAVCEICGQKFLSKSVLRNHMRVHSSDRPFKCDQCSATFKFSAALYTHNKLVHLKVKSNVKKKKNTLKTKEE